MKAIGFSQSLPIANPNSLQDIELPMPVTSGHDLLIKIEAIATNPVDYKVRQGMPSESGEMKVLGWDAVGEVTAVGESTSLFNIGDKVFYAGDLTRQGCNAEYQLIDERLVGLKPASLSNAEAAALPLTTITAWEMLFSHLELPMRKANSIRQNNDDILLITGASGGVGSIMIQLARQLTNATVIATASRPESSAWVTTLGADYVIDHTQSLAKQITDLGLSKGVTHIAGLTHSDRYLESYIEILQPFGKITITDDPKTLDVMLLKPKSLSLHLEFMFTRSMFKTDDMIEQHNMLTQVANLIDESIIKTTIGQNLGHINAANLRHAHEQLESGKAIGKIVLEGF